jgi:hypothetical protein
MRCAPIRSWEASITSIHSRLRPGDGLCDLTRIFAERTAVLRLERTLPTRQNGHRMLRCFALTRTMRGRHKRQTNVQYRLTLNSASSAPRADRYPGVAPITDKHHIADWGFRPQSFSAGKSYDDDRSGIH